MVHSRNKTFVVLSIGGQEKKVRYGKESIVPSSVSSLGVTAVKKTAAAEI